MAPESGTLKWVVLALACLATFGGYFSFDFPSVLHNPLRRHFGVPTGEFEFYFSLLYSLYSIPNMVLPGLGGVLSDVLGNDKVMLGCASLVLLGNVLQLVACVRVDLVTLEVGRFVFGLGAETLQVCATTVIAKWFHGSELALALAINLSACKLGGVLTDWVSPYIAHTYGVKVAAGVVTALCAVCFLLTLLLVYYDSRGSALQLLHPAKQRAQPNYQTIPSADDNPAPAGVEERGSIEMTTLSADPEASTDEAPLGKADSGSFSFRHFSVGTWLLFVLTFVMYGVFIPFNNVSNGVILEVFFPDASADPALQSREEVAAARLQSVPYALSVLVIPALGWAIDRFGCRAALMVLSASLLFLAHAYIFVAHSGPMAPLLLIGLAYSIYGSVSWACVPLIVTPSHHGAAYGVMCAFQNAGQSLVPLLLQKVIRNSGAFRDCELLLAALAVLALVLSAALYAVDYKRNGNVLQVTTV